MTHFLSGVIGLAIVFCFVVHAVALPIPEVIEAHFNAKRAGVPRKRGLLFDSHDNAQATTYSNLFTGSTSQVAWATNYGQTRDGIIQYIGFVPLLWDLAPARTSSWISNVNNAVTQGGSKYAIYLNEPDLNNISPAAAAAGFKQYMQPLAGKIKLGGPAIIGQSQGLTWLSQFYTACSSSVADSVNNIKYTTTQTIAASGGRPVWLSEFTFLNGTPTADKISVLKQVMPWLDSNANVFRYGYYVYDLVTNNVLNSMGNVYNTFT